MTIDIHFKVRTALRPLYGTLPLPGSTHSTVRKPSTRTDKAVQVASATKVDQASRHSRWSHARPPFWGSSVEAHFGEGDVTKQKSVKRGTLSLNQGKSLSE